MRCLLIGNYGVGNLGDEALREYFLRTFPEIKWTVVSSSPSRPYEVPRLPCGIRSMFRPWWRTIGAIAASNAVVFGGGSLFTDSESAFACLLWWWHAFVVRLFHTPIFLTFQGVGPLCTAGSITLTRWVFRRAAYISVRDEASLKQLQKWNLGVLPILTFDPVFSLFASRKRQPDGQRMLVVIPRGNSTEEFMIAVSGKLAFGWDVVRILLMKPGAEEHRIAGQIQSMTNAPAQIVETVSVDQLLDEVATAQEVVAQRYHGALAALAMGVPVMIVPQEAGDKLDGLRAMQSAPVPRDELLRLVETGAEAFRDACRKQIAGV